MEYFFFIVQLLIFFSIGILLAKWIRTRMEKKKAAQSTPKNRSARRREARE